MDESLFIQPIPCESALGLFLNFHITYGASTVGLHVYIFLHTCSDISGRLIPSGEIVIERAWLLFSMYFLIDTAYWCSQKEM